MLPSTAQRVPQNTAEQVNRAIREETEKNVACHAAGGEEAIGRRLRELEHEWDIERVLELNAPIVASLGLLLGATRNRGWYLLTAAVLGLLAQHSIQGWCPPVPLLRRLGFRTQTEIAEERYALKAIRGDFHGLPQQGERPQEHVRELLAAVRR